ncbi:MAG: hypothetical protein ACYC61_00460 [Isosphaeraceae bacterium]
MVDADPTVWVAEIVEQLEISPEECRLALESLSAVEDRLRVPILSALAAYRERPAVRTLLRLLGASNDPGIRQAAREALTTSETAGRADRDQDAPDSEGPEVVDDVDRPPAGVPGLRVSAVVESLPVRPAGRFARSLVTAVDGDGRGTIVLSRDVDGRCHTAAFRCDLLCGIVDAAGEVESGPPPATDLVDRWLSRFGPSDGYLLDAPELAVGLLGGSFHLGRSELPGRVRTLLDELFGAHHLPAGLPPFRLDDEVALRADELPARAELVLDACPSWLDRSPLTCELAREIALRDEHAIPDPFRDAGAFRYLFEHRLSRRLELYARMLLWMTWVWRGTGYAELARAAHVLAGQLADEQYAVPSHPFIVALSARSLRAAQATIGDNEPRRPIAID